MSELKKVENRDVEAFPIFDTKQVIKNQMNKLATDIITTEVSEKTIEGYFTQISHNLTIGKKAEFLVRRDLADATKYLMGSQFEELGDLLMGMNEELSKGTLSKWVSIGKSDYCNKLYIENKLPMTWTTQYELSKLSAPEQVKVSEMISADTTAKEIKQVLNPDAEEDSDSGEVVKAFDDYSIERPTTVFKIGVSTVGADSNKLYKLSTALQKLVDEINDMETPYTFDEKDMKVELLTRNNVRKKDESYIDAVYDKNLNHFMTYEKQKQNIINKKNKDRVMLRQMGLSHLEDELPPVKELPENSGLKDFADLRKEVNPIDKVGGTTVLNGITLNT